MCVGTGLSGRVKSPCRPLSDGFSVIPAQAGIQGFQSLALGPRLRGDDDFGCEAGFLHSLFREGDEIAWMTGFTHGLLRRCDKIRVTVLDRPIWCEHSARGELEGSVRGPGTVGR